VSQPAILVFADGTVFRGTAIGAKGSTVGEVVFNTAMTGYQEILSDPSYASQIVTLTYPHIGNVGTTSEDDEAAKPWAAGLIIRDLSMIASNWRQQETLNDYLINANIVGIADIDTRALTHYLRDKGAQNACIQSGEINEQAALEQARTFAGLEQVDLAKDVTTNKPYQWHKGSWQLTPNTTTTPAPLYHVVVYDYGVKHNILRMLVDRGCRVTVIPAKASVEECLAYQPDGILLSNGPGDPAACTYAIAAIKELLQKDIPLFGICLGHQLLALACEAQTEKMKFGHHGANHPVQDLVTSRVMITSQNHGFAVREAGLPSSLMITHRSLFDGSIQGIKHQTKPAYGFQGHPEASPGPHDIADIFDNFIQMMQHRVPQSEKQPASMLHQA
jgi:carbamoyl-phosphate synthase small subunit